MAKKRVPNNQSILDNPWTEDDIAFHASFLEEERTRPAPRPDFSNVERGYGTTETAPVEPSLVDRYFALQDSARESAIGGLQRTLGSAGFAAANGSLPTGFAALVDLLPDQLREEAKAFYGGQVTAGTERAKHGEQLQDIANLPGPLDTVARGVTDILGSPSSLGSIPGGPFAAIPAADVYAQEYTAGIQGGLSDREAEARAAALAGVEGGISAIPAGKYIYKLTGGMGKRAVSSFLRGRGSNVASGIIKTSLGEGAEEATTEAAQAGIDKLLAEQGVNERVRGFSETQAPKSAVELWERVKRAGVAGAVGGGAIGSPFVVLEDAAKAGALAADINAKYDPYIKHVESGNKTSKPRIRVPTETALPGWTDARTEERQDATGATVDRPATEEIDDMLASLRSEPLNGSGNATTRDVIKSLTDNINQGDARKIAKMMQDQNVLVVEKDSHIPNGAQARGAAGYYDGKRTYIVANRIDKNKPIVGQVMDTLAHETVHAGDVSGKLDSVLVGSDNNAALNDKIRFLADRSAKARNMTLEDVSQLDSNSDAFRSLPPELKAYHYADKHTKSEGAKAMEMVAYYVSFAREGRGNATLLKDIVSATRSKWNKAVGNSVNLNDVAYLSDKLVEQAAVKGERLTGNVAETVDEFGGGDDTGLNMIGGRNATGFNAAELRGDVYQEPLDNGDRFEFSDHESSVTNDELKLRAAAAGQTFKLGDLFNHNELYKQYPNLRDSISITGDPSLTAVASYNADDRTIRVQPTVLREAATGNAGALDELRTTILHEVQHDIQDKEGFVKGANVDMFVPAVVRNRLATAKARMKNAFDKFEVGRAIQALHPVERQQFDRARSLEGIGPTEAQKMTALFFDDALAFYKNVRDPVVQQQVRRYIQAKEDVAHEQKQYNKEYNKALTKYAADQGEAEARNTEFRANMTQEDRDFMKPQDTMLRDSMSRELGITKADLHDASKGGRVAKAESAGLAQVAIEGFDRSNVEKLDKKNKGRFARTFERLFVPGGFTDTQLQELLRHANSLPASMAQRGTLLNNRFREAIDENVRKSNGKFTDESFRNMLSSKIEAIDKMDSLEAREFAMDALDRQYPGVGKALNELRQYKLSLTRNILMLRRRDPKKLTEKERNIYAKMVHNAERYTTRAYLATYDKEVASQYGKQMIKQFHNDPNSEEAKTVQAALDYLVSKELTIPDAETLGRMKTDQIRRMHETWVGSTDDFKGDEGKDRMIRNLLAVPEKTKKEIDQKAYETVLDMLGVTETKKGLAKEFTPSMRQNRTILEARKDIPPPLRKLLGEITDPLLREAISLNRMINLATRTKFLTETFERGEGKWWAEIKTPKFGIQLNSPAYGPLDGKFVSQDLADAITGTVMNMRGTDEALAEVVQNGDLLMKVLAGKSFPIMKSIMSAQKTYGVVADVYNGLINFVGALVFMAPMNGQIPGLNGYSFKGMKGAAKTLLLDIWDRKISEPNSKIVEELLMAGVTDSATMGEFKGHAYDGIKKELKKLGGQDNLTPGKILKAVYRGAMAQHKLGDAMRTAYAFMDVWVKAATYYDRKAYNEKLNKAEGLNMTEEELIRKSGYEAAGTNISYERGIPAAKMLEKNIPLFMFLTYKTEVVRATAMSFAQGIADLQTAINAKTPEGRMLATSMGLKRLAGTSAVLATIIGGTVAHLAGEDDDEKKKRALDFSWMQNQVMTMLGKDDEGNEVMWNLSRIDPLGPMNELITSVANAPEGRVPETVVKAFGDYLFAESKGVMAVYKVFHDATVASLATALGNESIREWDMDMQRKGVVERNYPELYQKLQRLPGNIGENLAEVGERLFLPGSLRPFIDERGKTDSALGEALRYSGMSMYVRDADKSLTRFVIDHDKSVEQLKKQRDAAAKAGNLDRDKMTDLIEKEYESFTDLSRAYEGYLAFDGKKVSDAVEIIGNKKLAAQVRTGRFKSTLVDTKLLDSWKKRELKKRGADPKEINEQYREMKKLYSEVD